MDMSGLQFFRPALETFVIVSMVFLSGKQFLIPRHTQTLIHSVLGLASCLSLWVIPIALLPENSTQSIVAQFNETIHRGAKFLQPSSRLLTVALVLLTILTSRHPDAAIASRWRYQAGAGIVVAQTAWYERVYIFPINDQVKAIGEKPKFEDADRMRLISLLRRWQRLHWGRVLLPLASGILAFAAVL